ncbi:MAG TPA: diacylglycerol kinase family protein [Candidatus Acidoferrales bacterium]|nr:diacylglycerol kinase family protein [Candidatus Acidoferrales bacterium]
MPHEIKDALLIYNPTSGRKRHTRFVEIEQAARSLKDAGIVAELAATTGPGTATTIARQAVEQRRGMVIACGGDGTINEIVNGLARSQVPMALLPAGTANILAKELRIPWDIPRAARLIPGGEIRRIALGVAIPMHGNDSTAIPRAGRYFLSVAGAGPDGAIVNGVHKGLKDSAGVLAYWAEGMRQLFRYGFPEMRIRSGGRDRRATIIVAGRTAHYGGPFKITTGASLFEDSFEFLTNSRRSRLGYLSCLPAMWLGTLRDKPGIEAWKATESICESANGEAVYAQVDGEPAGPIPIAFRIVPDALSIVTPASK